MAALILCSPIRSPVNPETELNITPLLAVDDPHFSKYVTSFLYLFEDLAGMGGGVVPPRSQITFLFSEQNSIVDGEIVSTRAKEFLSSRCLASRGLRAI